MIFKENVLVSPGHYEVHYYESVFLLALLLDGNQIKGMPIENGTVY